MKHTPTPLPCDIVRDLLPLYHDGVVSEAAALAVAHHLEGCPPCRREYEDLCTALPEETPQEDSTLDKFDKTMRTVQRKRTKRAVLLSLLGGLLLVALYLLLFHIPLVNIPPEDIDIALAYQYETDGKEKFFLLYSTPNYLGGTSEPDFETTLDGSVLVVRQKKALLAWKVTDSDYPWLPEPHRFFHFYPFDADLFTDGVHNLSLHDCTAIRINDQVIWDEATNGDDPIPDYIYAYEEYCSRNPVSFYINLNKEEVGLFHMDGRNVTWDLEGNLLSGSVSDLP